MRDAITTIIVRVIINRGGVYREQSAVFRGGFYIIILFIVVRIGKKSRLFLL